MRGLSRSAIYELQAEQRFPQAIKITERSVGWLEGEIQEWLANHIERSRRRTSRGLIALPRRLSEETCMAILGD
jgi:predicted DNA-binding transcriptional regulator AlpA